MIATFHDLIAEMPSFFSERKLAPYDKICATNRYYIDFFAKNAVFTERVMATTFRRSRVPPGAQPRICAPHRTQRRPQCRARA